MEMCGLAAATASRGLAANGDLAALHDKAHAGEIHGDAFGKRRRLSGLKDSREGVGAGNGAGKLEPLAQPTFAQLANEVRRQL